METTFKNKVNDLRTEWESKIEELELQLTLGKAEAHDKFEQSKSNFQRTVNDLKARTGELEHLGKEKAQDLKMKLEELQVQLNLGKAETRDVFEKQKGKLEELIDEAQKSFDAFREDAGEKIDRTEHEFIESAERFKSKLDTFRLHYTLAKAEVKDELEERRKYLKSNLKNLRDRYEIVNEITEEKWVEFKDEMVQSLGHLKEGFRKLLD